MKRLAAGTDVAYQGKVWVVVDCQTTMVYIRRDHKYKWVNRDTVEVVQSE